MRDVVDGVDRTVRPKTLWMDPRFDSGVAKNDLKKLIGGAFFDTPKSVHLLEQVLNVSGSNDAIILDFFAGSCSSAHAAIMANARDGGSRRFIQVQLPEPFEASSDASRAGFRSIADLGRERISRAAELVSNEIVGTGVDGGYRAFKLSDSNFSKWHSSSETDRSKLGEQLLELRESANDDATPSDLLFEILLKQGYSLTEKVDIVSVAGIELQSVADGVLLAYLDEHVKPSLEQLRAAIVKAPARLIVLEDAFHGDDELKTNLAQLCKSNGIELWTA